MDPGPPRSEAEWRSEIATLRALVERLGAQLNEQAEVITALKRENEQLKRENEQLRHENALLLRRVLGPTSEKMPSVSQELRRKTKHEGKQDGKAKRRANKTLRANQRLDTEEHEHRVADDQRTCPSCPGVRLEPLGEPETSVEYEYVPARFKRRVHRREKLCCPRCKSHVVTAPAPLKVFDKARYGSGFISHLIVTKCADAVPLYRQAKQLVRLGVPVARSTMTDLFHRAAAALRPLVERMLQLIAQATHVQGDETSFRVQEPVKCRRGFIWTFIGAGLIAYRFSADRSGETSVDGSKPATRGRVKTGHQAADPRRVDVYLAASWWRKSPLTLVRQLRGPHLTTWAWCSRRSSSAVTAAVSPSSLPQSSTGRLEVSTVEARS